MTPLDQLIEMQGILIEKGLNIPENKNKIQPCGFTAAYVELKKHVENGRVRKTKTRN